MTFSECLIQERCSPSSYEDVVIEHIHYNDVIISTMASQITGVSIVYWIVCSGADQRKHQSSVSLAFVRGIHRWQVNSPHKGPVTRKMFPFDDVIMLTIVTDSRFRRMTSDVASWGIHTIRVVVSNTSPLRNKTLIDLVFVWLSQTQRPNSYDSNIQIVKIHVPLT